MMMILQQGKLMVDFKGRAIKGYCKGKEGFKAQMKELKELFADVQSV
jgi:hypothetical protein